MEETNYQKYGKKWYEENKERSHANWKRYHRRFPEKSLYRGARLRAKNSNLEFNIELSDIIVPSVCPILHTPFEVGTMQAASLDRIDNTKGYIKGNVWVISRRANTMKGDCNIEMLKSFAEWVGTL